MRARHHDRLCRNPDLGAFTIGECDPVAAGRDENRPELSRERLRCGEGPVERCDGPPPNISASTASTTRTSTASGKSVENGRAGAASAARSQIARDVAHKFHRSGVGTSTFDEAHIGFSHTDGTLVVIEALQLARKNGARTIAVTNYLGSPIAELADVVLCSTARESPLLGENAAARIAQLNILDAIFVLVAQRARAVAERNLSRTMDAVRTKRKA
jgi:hypothetical protein